MHDVSLCRTWSAGWVALVPRSRTNLVDPSVPKVTKVTLVPKVPRVVKAPRALKVTKVEKVSTASWTHVKRRGRNWKVRQLMELPLKMRTFPLKIVISSIKDPAQVCRHNQQESPPCPAQEHPTHQGTTGIL